MEPRRGCERRRGGLTKNTENPRMTRRNQTGAGGTPRGKLRADLSRGHRQIRGVVTGRDRGWSGAVVVLRVAPGIRSHRWGQEVKQAIGEADIYIASENPYQGTGRYFSRLARQYRPGDATGEEGLPVTCVNLLRCAPGKPELLLSEHFHEAVRGVRKRSGLSAITVLNFDWHANIKSLGEAKTVEGLWTALRSYLVDAGVSHGVCEAGSDPTRARTQPARPQPGLGLVVGDGRRRRRRRSPHEDDVQVAAGRASVQLRGLAR